MYRFLAALLIFTALAATNVASFQVVSPASAVASRIAKPTTTASSTFASSATTTTTTAMNMVRVKVDPKDQKESSRINPAVFKNALYLGSIGAAILLPIFFLIASSK